MAYKLTNRGPFYQELQEFDYVLQIKRRGNEKPTTSLPAICHEQL